MANDGFWRSPLASQGESLPFRIKRFLNFFDDSVSPALRSRRVTSAEKANNTLLTSPKSFNNLLSQPETPRTASKSLAERFSDCIYGSGNVDVDKLRKLAWSGIPSELRPIAWKLLIGYLPANTDRHQLILDRKRREYRDIVEKYFGADPRATSMESLSDAVKTAKSRPTLDLNDEILHQISIDVPRTCPDSPMFQYPQVKQSLLRVLYCWSIRRPATGYVQGINDLATPFFDVFIREFVKDPNSECYIEEEDMLVVEADVFWCLSNLLDTIQDNYTFNQSGIYRQVSLLKNISLRMDPLLVNHMESESIEFIQFAFRWMNCLLLREFRLPIIKRLWDSYLAEGPEGFKTFHVYICAAFLLKWKRELQLLEFQDLIVFLQAPPTDSWTDREVELLVAEAFVLKNLFQNAPL